MVTLRVFDSAIEAGLAKTLLSDNGIECELADEASHELSGAAVAVPVRLLVKEERAEEALRILKNPGPRLPENFEPPEMPAESPNQSDLATQVQELRKTVRRLVIASTILFFLLWCFIAYLLTDRPDYVTRLYRAITTASRQPNVEKARRLAERAVKQYPREYWSHEWLAKVEFDGNNLKAAEIEYQRAYDLLPNERIRKRLQEIRIHTQSQPSPSPATSP